MEQGARARMHGRQAASLALAVVGAVLLFVGGIALYAREEIFDADSFARHASDALGDERVDEAIAEPIVDQVIANGPDELINARPLLSAATQGVLDSRPFRDAFSAAASRVHRQLFSRERDELILNVADAGAFVIDAVKAISPQTAKSIPKDLEPGLIELTESDFAIETVRAGEDVRFLGLLLPGLGILLLAASVGVAPDRRRGVVRASAAVAIAAAIGVIALVIGRSLVLGQFDDDVTRDAVDAVWGNFLDGLRAWFLGVGVAAIVVAAAASAPRAVDVAAPARRLARFAVRTPERAAGRAIRAVSLLVASAFVVLRPDLALNIVAVLLGAYGLFLAVSEIMLLIAPPPAEAPERVALRRRVRPRAAALAGGALAATVAIAIALLAGGGGEAQRPGGPVEACNGYPELCELRLNEVTFPGAHNAMSAADAGFITPNQKTGIPKQLDRGIRVLLIDAHYGIKRKSGPVLTDLEREQTSKVREAVREQFGKDAVDRVLAINERAAKSGGEGEPGVYLCHVVCELGATDLTEALTGVRKFLDTHPDEFVIVVIEDYVKPEDIEKAFKDSGLLRYAYVHERDTPFPTLRELIESDRRMLVMAENDNGGGSIAWYHDGFELMQETPFTFNSAEELEDAKQSCKPNRGGRGGPLLQLNHWVEKLPRSPSLGREVNGFDFLLDRARECRRRRGRLQPNLVAVDFYDEGDVFEASRKLNGLKRDAKPQVRKTG